VVTTHPLVANVTKKLGSRRVKDDDASQRKRGKIGPPLPQKPLNRSLLKFAWVITSGTPTPKQNSSRYDSHQVTRLVFLIFVLVLSSTYSQDPYTDFHDQYVKWRGFAQRCAFWRSQKHIFTFRPHFPPKTHFFANFRLTILRQAGLNNGDAHL